MDDALCKPDGNHNALPLGKTSVSERHKPFAERTESSTSNKAINVAVPPSDTMPEPATINAPLVTKNSPPAPSSTLKRNSINAPSDPPHIAHPEFEGEMIGAERPVAQPDSASPPEETTKRGVASNTPPTKQPRHWEG